MSVAVPVGQPKAFFTTCNNINDSYFNKINLSTLNIYIISGTISVHEYAVSEL